jgi:DNA-directed RNA polymerase subunit RPC12/RpoP
MNTTPRTRRIYAVTFEGPNVGGLDWSVSDALMRAAYADKIASEDYAEDTVTLWSVDAPADLEGDALTEWLDRELFYGNDREPLLQRVPLPVRPFVVHFTSMVVDAQTESEAIERAPEMGGGNWEAVEVREPDTTGRDLVQAMKDAIAAVQEFGQTKALEVRVTKKGHLKCPHCGARDMIQERDYDMRVNEGEVDYHGSRPSPTYVRVHQGDDEYETIAYECANVQCGAIVSLPDGVEVSWS